MYKLMKIQLEYILMLCYDLDQLRIGFLFTFSSQNLVFQKKKLAALFRRHIL